MRWANSLPMMARWMAGRLAFGGPDLPSTVFFPSRLALPGEAQVLQVGVGDARHQPVPVQPGPGPAVVVPDPELALELLVRLLAHPARLDRSHQRTQRSAGRQVGKVELGTRRWNAIRRPAKLPHPAGAGCSHRPRRRPRGPARRRTGPTARPSCLTATSPTARVDPPAPPRRRGAPRPAQAWGPASRRHTSRTSAL